MIRKRAPVDGVTLDDHRGGSNQCDHRQQPKSSVSCQHTIRTVPGVPWSSHPVLGRRPHRRCKIMLLEILSE